MTTIFIINWKRNGFKKLVENYAGYNEWANGVVVEFLKVLPPNLLILEVKSSFSTILQTLQHILVAQEFWLSVVAEVDYKASDNSDSEDVSNILMLVIQSADNLNKFVKNLSVTDLEKEISTPWINDKLPIYEVLQHCFNHSSYHRGQLTTIFRQLEFADIPNVDFYEYLKVEVHGNP